MCIGEAAGATSTAPFCGVTAQTFRYRVKLPDVLRMMLSAKIHRATVTHADLHYVGSITIDLDILFAAGIMPGEKVSVVDVTNGARLETYTIAGEPGSGVVGINGAAAHLVHVGDLIIVIAYALLTTEEASEFRPRIVHVDAANRIVDIGSDAASAVVEGLSRPPCAV